MGLTEIIQTKLVDIADVVDSPVQFKLNHGLILHLRRYVDKPGYMLTLIREGVDPSVQEWNTVIAFWPWDLGAINWDRDGCTKDGLHFKQAHIRK